MKNRDIIITGIQPWDIRIGSNCKNIAAEWAKHNRVLYVNSPLGRMTVLRRSKDASVARRLQIVRTRQRIERIDDNLWTLYPAVILESINQIRPAPLFDFLNRINNKRLAKEISSAIQELGFRDFVLFTDSDMFRSFYLKELLNPWITIYYTRDYLLGKRYWRTNGLRIEPAHMKKADLVVANSAHLAEQARAYNPFAFDVGQGCDLEFFQQAQAADLPMPGDLAGLPRPLVGYVGALAGSRLDIDLLISAARLKPDWSWVLVGPQDEQFLASELQQMANVHFLGEKKPEELYLYINRFDVAINPQRLNQATIGNYPRKIDEYLAMGKPTVAIKTQTMELFQAHVLLAENSAEFCAFCEKAFKEDTPEKANARKAFAATHTWENSVNRIDRAIKSVKGAQR